MTPLVVTNSALLAADLKFPSTAPNPRVMISRSSLAGILPCSPGTFFISRAYRRAGAGSSRGVPTASGRSTRFPPHLVKLSYVTF